MRHPPQFLRTILAQPRADRPRLEYAEWLEGCQNPLGEFIRVQCALANDRSGTDSGPNERRQQELLADFHERWSFNIAGCVEWCHFRRGFIEEIALTDSQLIAHANDLFRQAPIMEVHLRPDDDRLDELPALPYLRHTLFLDLSSHFLGDEGVERLAESPLLAHVHGLNLGTCEMGDVGLDALIDLPDLSSLRELYINDNFISDESIRRFVLSPIAEQLVCLDVRDTHLSDEGLSILQRVLGDRCLI